MEWYPTVFSVGTNTVYYYINDLVEHCMDQISIYMRMTQSYFLLLNLWKIQPGFRKI